MQIALIVLARVHHRVVGGNQDLARECLAPAFTSRSRETPYRFLRCLTVSVLSDGDSPAARLPANGSCPRYRKSPLHCLTGHSFAPFRLQSGKTPTLKLLTRKKAHSASRTWFSFELVVEFARRWPRRVRPSRLVEGRDDWDDFFGSSRKSAGSGCHPADGCDLPSTAPGVAGHLKAAGRNGDT
jgi:hypothetical protein